MFDATKYLNDVPYPIKKDKDDFIAVRLAELDNTPMRRDEYNARFAALQDEAEKYIIGLRSAWNNREVELRNQFCRDAEDYFVFAFLPDKVKAMIHSYAWDRGHSAGYEEVYWCYPDVVEIALAAYEAGKSK